MQRKQPLPHTWPHEESRGCKFEPKVMGEVLDAVVALNDQLLEALASSARTISDTFPLPDSLRTSFAAISDGQRRLAARCGVLLADAGFSDDALWRRIALPSEHNDARSNDTRAWLSSEESVVLCYSALMVAWYIVHTTPGASGVLLGMSDAVLEEFRSLGVGDLALIARRRPNWIRPRWIDRPDVWLDLIDDQGQDDIRATSVPLRCLTVSAAYAPNLLASMEAGG
jgi:hypothetical protein